MKIYLELLQAVIALFVIIDPLGNLPIFMGLTEGMNKEKRKNTFIEALLVGFVLLIVFVVAGTGILVIFNITIDDFKIAGGILLLVISLIILIRGQYIDIVEDGDIGAFPLGCPLLVGPGAITTAIVLIGLYGMNLTLVAVAINFLIAGCVLYFGDKIYNMMGKPGAVIIAKVMAIILAAIAVKFIRQGITAFFGMAG